MSKPFNPYLLSGLLLLACYPNVFAAAPTVGGCSLFPDDAMFNVRIDNIQRFPKHAQSDLWIGRIGVRAVHLDFGRNEDPDAWSNPDNGYWGIPFNVVDGTAATTDWPTVSFTITDPRAGNGDGVPDESDCAVSLPSGFGLVRGCDTLAPGAQLFPYPKISNLKAEYGNCNDAQNCGDRHVLVVEQGQCRLWESYFSYHIDNQWYAYSTAGWDLNSYALRPNTWTSGDAAGLPILPLLARVDEAQAGLIQHAFRVTLQDSLLTNIYTWPARHRAGGAVAQGIPFGSLMRLKSDVVIPDTWSIQARAIAKAMQNYGLYIADIGSNMYIQGEPNAQWDEAIWGELQSLHASDFEFVDLSAISNDAQFDANSLKVPAALITADDDNSQPPGGGGGGGGTPPPDTTPAGGGGCTLSQKTGTIDAVLPLLILLASYALWRQKRKADRKPIRQKITPAKRPPASPRNRSRPLR